MKISKFVIEMKDFPVDDIYFWYSTATDNATIVSSKVRQAILNQSSADEKEIAIINKLSQSKYLVPDDFDETKWSQYIFNSVNYSRQNLGIVITPTMECNFKCIYCNETKEQKKNRMTHETATGIIEWIDQTITENPIKKLDVQYFGGEPTQNMEILSFFAEQIIRLKQKHAIQTKNFLITNGYFSQDIIDQVKLLEINHLHFTIDGNKNCHDARKPLTTGESTFNTVYSNFIYAVKKGFDDILLRINIDESNENDILPLLRQIKNEIDPNLITVDINPTSWINKKDYDEIYKSVYKLTEEAIELGFKYDFHIGNYDSCNFTKINNIVIGTDGSVYRCLLMVGEEKFKVDSYKNYFNHPKLIEFVTDEVADDCYQCKFSPICFGGCRAAAFRTHGIYKKKDCRKDYFNKYMIPYLKLYYQKKIAERVGC